MNPRPIWFILILLFVVSANPGADKLVVNKPDVDANIRCSNYRSIEPITGQPEKPFRLELLPRSEAEKQRKLIIDNDVEIEMNCFWQARVYRCEWSDYHYIEFYVDDVWKPVAIAGQPQWKLFPAKWFNGPVESQPKNVHCGQRQ